MRLRPAEARPNFVLAVAIALVAMLGACSTDRDVGLWLRVTNDTDDTVTVTYEGPGGPMELGDVEAGRLVLIESVFEELGPICTGPFVARSRDGHEVARLEETCPNTDWSVKDSRVSPSAAAEPAD